MNVNDLIKICNVQMIYDLDKGFTTYYFNDALTGLQVIFPINVLEFINKSIIQHIKNNDIVPITAVFRGHFTQDSENIYATYLESLCIFELKATSCYIDFYNKSMIFRDDIFNLPVKFTNMSVETENQLNNYITLLSNKYEFNFSKNGLSRFIILGQISDLTKSITYDYNNIMMLDIAPIILDDMYSYIISLTE